MSKIKVQSPIVHTPGFTEYQISGVDLAKEYSAIGVDMKFPRSDNWYFHTDEEGWMKVLVDLAFKSSLYKKDKFDCEDYALKAQVTCAERYGLNTLRYTYGMTPLGAHGFNSLWTGDRFLLFEPNDGFSGSPVFEIGENGYTPTAVLI